MSIFFGVLSIIALLAFLVGMLKPQWMVFWSDQKTKKTACLYLIPVVLFAAIFFSSFYSGAQSPVPASASGSPTSGSSSDATANPSSPDSSSSISSSSSATSSPAASTPSNASSSSPSSAVIIKATPSNLKSFSTTLLSGYYTVGVDLPAGTYKITAHKGTGTFATSDNSVNAKLSKVADATHQQVIKNVAIHDGTTVSVTGVTVKIVCKEKVDLSKLKERTNTATKTYKLKPGSYTIGNDMEAGTYDLYTEDGSGTVATTDGKFSISVGSDTSDANQRRFKNVTFQKGQTLKITGATMKFSPSD